MRTRRLAEAIRLALLAGLVIPPGIAGAAADDDDPHATPHAPPADRTTPGTMVLTREDLERSGYVSLGDVLQRLPQHGSALNPLHNGGGNGEHRVDLRHLGSQRTLVLVDDHRWITGLAGATDLTTIPWAAIERVEITFGADGARHGSGAISAVPLFGFDGNNVTVGASSTTPFGRFGVPGIPGIPGSVTLIPGEDGAQAGDFRPFDLARDGFDIAPDNHLLTPQLEELYAELDLPLLADRAFARSLELALAARWSDYTTVGDTTNASAGFRWRPFADLLVHGAYADGFRAPAIAELFAGTSDVFPSAPCALSSYANGRVDQATWDRCRNGITDANGRFIPGVVRDYETDTQIRATIGGSTDLRPEQVRSRTLGFRYAPKRVEGLAVHLDWYRIEVSHPIGFRSAEAVAFDCDARQDLVACTRITRNRFGDLQGVRRQPEPADRPRSRRLRRRCGLPLRHAGRRVRAALGRGLHQLRRRRRPARFR
jgi:outer membrane receptor protein involved in Fe transport